MKRRLLVIAILFLGAFSFTISDAHAGRIAKFATAGRPKLGHRMQQRQCRKSLRQHQPVIIVVAEKKPVKVENGKPKVEK